MKWLDKYIDQRIGAYVAEQLGSLEASLRKDLTQRDNTIGYLCDQTRIDKGSTLSILDITTQDPEYWDCFLDLSDMRSGDALKIKVSIRFPWSDLPFQYLTKEVSAIQEDPVFRIPTLLVPKGGQVAVEHLAGRRMLVGYAMLRHR